MPLFRAVIGDVHEAWAGLRAGLQYHGPVHLQQPAGPEGGGQEAEEHRGRGHGPGGEQVRPGGGARRRQGQGSQHGRPSKCLQHHRQRWCKIL